jgi:hypothetical protein
MFQFQLIVIISNCLKNSFYSNSGTNLTPKTNLLLKYIYKIIYSIFYISLGHNKNFNVGIPILINYGWHQNFWHRDSDRDQIWSGWRNYPTLIVKKKKNYPPLLWQEKAGVSLPRSYRGILDEARMRNHTYKHTIPWYSSYKAVITY